MREREREREPTLNDKQQQQKLKQTDTIKLQYMIMWFMHHMDHGNAKRERAILCGRAIFISHLTAQKLMCAVHTHTQKKGECGNKLLLINIFRQ